MRGTRLSARNSFTSILMTCLLAAGFLGISSVADAASAGQSFRKSAESARNRVLENKRRDRVRIHLPLGPSYIYYDYPYYYCRGYYPTHIGGYVYYPSRPRYGGRCSNRHPSRVAKSSGACRCF
jgi:hypothetical protein